MRFDSIAGLTRELRWDSALPIRPRHARYDQIVKVRELIRLLESDGWRLRGTKGSHRQFKHSQKNMVVTVPGQMGKDVPVGTLKAILKTAGLDEGTS